MIRGLVTTTAKTVQKEDWKNLFRIMKSKVIYDAEAAMAFEYHIHCCPVKVPDDYYKV